jgi:2-keto-3-deoxy-L-rhamnonate aldolase RhmA
VPIGQAEAVAVLRAKTTVVALVETATGVHAAEEIAAVPGIDVLFLGSSDLAADLGVEGNKDAATLWEAAKRIVAACRAHGKTPGIGGITDNAHFERALSIGMRYLSAGHDAMLLQTAAAEKVASLRALTK